MASPSSCWSSTRSVGSAPRASARRSRSPRVSASRASTDADLYEAALQQAGFETHRTIGGGYYGRQQVSDLCAYLRLLRSRYDDRALLTVLASPLIGVSNPGL